MSVPPILPGQPDNSVPLQVNIEHGVTAKKAYAFDGSVSKGTRKTDRIVFKNPEFGDYNSEHYSFAVESAIVPTKPTPDWWQSKKSFVVLHVKEGHNSGYVKVNAESIRKRLGLSKTDFAKEVERSEGDLTALIQDKMKGSTSQLPSIVEAFAKLKGVREGIIQNKLAGPLAEHQPILQQAYDELLKAKNNSVHKDGTKLLRGEYVLILRGLYECGSLLFQIPNGTEDLNQQHFDKNRLNVQLERYLDELVKLNDDEGLKIKGEGLIKTDLDTDEGSLSLNYKEGIKFLKKAVEAGSLSALDILPEEEIKGDLTTQQMLHLAKIHSTRGFTKKNEGNEEEGKAEAAKAFGWYLQAANKGDAEGVKQTVIGYRSGIGVERDITKAIHLYQRDIVRSLDRAKITKNRKYWERARDSCIELAKLGRQQLKETLNEKDKKEIKKKLDDILKMNIDDLTRTEPSRDALLEFYGKIANDWSWNQTDATRLREQAFSGQTVTWVQPGIFSPPRKPIQYKA